MHFFCRPRGSSRSIDPSLPFNYLLRGYRRPHIGRHAADLFDLLDIFSFLIISQREATRSTSTEHMPKGLDMPMLSMRGMMAKREQRSTNKANKPDYLNLDISFSLRRIGDGNVVFLKGIASFFVRW